MSKPPGKLYVVDVTDGSEVPFLRGILTRSLQKAGIPFEEAYKLASEVREKLQSLGEIRSSELRKRVTTLLRKRGFDEEAEAYLNPGAATSLIAVRSRDGATSPFSKGQLADSLEICALGRERAYEIIQILEADLIGEEVEEISSTNLYARMEDALRTECGDVVADNYRRWISFSRSGRPLILLVGGTTGCGKSTMSSEIAHRLNIVRTQSTDMLREVMRLMIPPRLIPTLHTSSFEAYQVLAGYASGSAKSTEPGMLEGYLTQSSQVAVGIEGVLQRAANERVSLILEGVHVHPALQHQIESSFDDAVVVPIQLAVLNKKRLKKNLVGRGQQITSRRSERYVENFDRIWKLQSFLLSEADRFNVPIVPNEDEEDTIRTIMQIVSEYLARMEETRPAQP